MKVSRKKGWRSFRSRTNCSLMSDVLIIEVLSGLNAETGFFLKNSECFQPKLHLGRWSATLAHWWLFLIPTDIKKCLKRDSLSHLSLSLSRTRLSDKMQPYPSRMSLSCLQPSLDFELKSKKIHVFSIISEYVYKNNTKRKRKMRQEKKSELNQSHFF